MLKTAKNLSLIILISSLSLPSIASSEVLSKAERLTIITDAIYPEGIEYDAESNEFILGSFRKGQIYRVNDQGESHLFIDNEEIITAMGVRVDRPRNRLLLAISDMGVSERKSISGTRSVAKLGEFDLRTGEMLRMTDLAALRPPSEKHIANDLAVDSEGNTYITDSLAPVIYKVDTNGVPSIFIEDPRLMSGEGFNGNGIVFHPDGYLLVGKKNEGAIFKVSLEADAPSLTRVQTDQAYVGADGLVLLNDQTLAIITNISGSVVSEHLYVLKTLDGWSTSQTVDAHPVATGNYPTTGVVANGILYVANSALNQVMRQFDNEQVSGFSRRARITPIYSLNGTD